MDHGLSEEQLDYIRTDLATNMSLTRLKINSEIIQKMKSENPNVTNQEIMKAIEERWKNYPI